MKLKFKQQAYQTDAVKKPPCSFAAFDIYSFIDEILSCTKSGIT